VETSAKALIERMRSIAGDKYVCMEEVCWRERHPSRGAPVTRPVGHTDGASQRGPRFQ